MNSLEPPVAPAAGRNPNLAWLAIGGIGVAVYLLIAVLSDAQALAEGLKQLGAAGVCVILGLSLANYLLRFARWHRYARMFGHRIPALRHLLYYLAGFAFTISPGKVGEALRSLYLGRHGVSYPESLAMLFSERLVDLVAITILALPLFIVDAESRSWSLPVLVALVALVAAIGGGRLSAVIRWMSVRAPAKWRRYFDGPLKTAERSVELLTGYSLAAGLAIGLAAWLAEGVGLAVLADGLGFEIGTVSGISIYAMAVLAGVVVFFVPAGIGGTEIVMTALLVNAGLPLNAALLATLLCRMATLWFAVLLGIAAVLVLHDRRMAGGQP